MAQGFFHGVETIEDRSGIRPINEVASAVIGLVGVAPRGGAPERIVLVKNETDAAQFGIASRENTIASALRAIFAQGSATILVVNVFDSTDTDHYQNVAQDYTIGGGKIRIEDRTFVDNLVVKTTGGSPVTLTLNVDYRWDLERQIVTVIDRSTYPDGTSLRLEYKAMTTDFSDYDSSSVIGLVASGEKTGLQKFLDANSERGYSPRILIAPQFSHRKEISEALITLAQDENIRGVAYIDAPYGATPDDAQEGRGSDAGVVKSFNTSSNRAVLFYPGVKALDVLRNDTEALFPLSQFAAGITANTDNAEGYWVSPSNHAITGITAMERTISWGLLSQSTAANELNAVGIVTIATGYGTGYRLWGNSTALFPSDTDPVQFIVVRRTADIINDSIARAMLPFMDKPIDPTIVDNIRASVNSFLNVMRGRGALRGGELKYFESDNPPTEIAQGKLVFRLEFMVPTPLQTLTFRQSLNISLLTNGLAA